MKKAYIYINEVIKLLIKNSFSYYVVTPQQGNNQLINCESTSHSFSKHDNNSSVKQTGKLSNHNYYLCLAACWEDEWD